MTYIVNDACIGCKYTDCVEVCPVDCFYEGENMLVIHPDEWVDFNRRFALKWPVIITRKEPLPDAGERDGEEGKLDRYFSEAPGEGG